MPAFGMMAGTCPRNRAPSGRIGIGRRTLAATLALALAVPAMAGTVDMRDCRLDTVTFIDAVIGGAFTVERVGRNVNYLCKDGARTEIGADDICAGPFGDLVLAGKLSEPGETPRSIFAVWRMEKAAPCCGWRILEEQAGSKLAALRGFRWLDGARAPRLG